MIGSIIGAGLSLAGTIGGGIASKKANDKIRQELRKQEAANLNYYNRRYNEDATQRADAQRAITMAEEAIKRQNKAIQGAQAVIGGNPAQVAAAAGKSAEAIGNTASAIAAQGESRKDAVESQYMQRKDALSGQQMQLDAAKSANIAQAAKGVGSAAASIAGALDDTSLKKQPVKSKGYEDKGEFSTASNTSAEDLDRINRMKVTGLPIKV